MSDRIDLQVWSGNGGYTLMKKKTIVSKIGILAVVMALSMTAVTGCGSKSGDRTSDEV